MDICLVLIAAQLDNRDPEKKNGIDPHTFKSLFIGRCGIVSFGVSSTWGYVLA